MLRKDNKNITKGIKDEFKDDLSFLTKRTKTVVFKLTSQNYNENKKPRSWSIESTYISRDKNGDASEFIYYKSVNTKNQNGVIQDTFSPQFLAFTERGDFSINVGENQSENLSLLVWFLNHPRLAQSKTGDGDSRPLFYLEDKNKEAIEKVRIKEERAEMDSYLFHEKTRLSDDKLKTIAIALRVEGVEDMNIQRIQTSIEDKCKKNPGMFLGMTEINDDVVMRANIQKAVEKGFLSSDKIKEKWFIQDTDSGSREPLAPIRKGDNEMDALVYWLKNVDISDHYGKIEELLTGNPKLRVEKDVPNNPDLAIELELLKEKNKTLELETEKAKAEARSAEAKNSKAEDIPNEEDETEAEKAIAEANKLKKKKPQAVK